MGSSDPSLVNATFSVDGLTLVMTPSTITTCYIIGLARPQVGWVSRLIRQGGCAFKRVGTNLLSAQLDMVSEKFGATIERARLIFRRRAPTPTSYHYYLSRYDAGYFLTITVGKDEADHHLLIRGFAVHDDDVVPTPRWNDFVAALLQNPVCIGLISRTTACVDLVLRPSTTQRLETFRQLLRLFPA